MSLATPYTRYLKQGQKITLSPIHGTPGRTETLTAHLQGTGTDHVDLLLPYGGNESECYPFTGEMPITLTSEAFGMGLRLDCRFLDRRHKNIVRLRIGSDLQAFQRRAHPRIDLDVGVKYTRGRGILRTFLSQWEKNIGLLHGESPLVGLGDFPIRHVNLSAGGIRFDIKGTADPADLFLLLLDCGPPQPICVLAEAVWSKPTENPERSSCGMRFVSILDKDKARLEALIHDRQGRLDTQGDKR